MLVKVIIHLILTISISKASHFYGGTLTWKPMNNTATGSTISVMFTQSYQFKRSISSANAYDYCDQTIILNQTPKIPNSNQNLICITNACANYVPIPINEYCTDFSAVRDSSSGQISTIQNITTGAVFCVAYQDSTWVAVWSPGCGNGCFVAYAASWSIVSCLNLTMRSDGFINTPPVATVISPIKVPINTITNIKIPIIDADNDYLKCRWSENTSTVDECASVCKTVPGGTIDQTNCILTFNSTGRSTGNYFAVAMMVEDFSDASSSTPFSSVPLQFLIQIVSTPTCPLKPTINSTLTTCTAVEVGVRFNFTLTITAGCSGTTIVDVNTNPPLYMYKGTLTRVGTTDVWTIDETWVPVSNQLGSQVFCALATDSASISSDQYCLTFFVVPAGSTHACPSEITTTSTTTSTTSTSTSTTSTKSTTTSTSTTSTSTQTTVTTSTTTITSTSTTTFTSTSTTTTSTTTTSTSTSTASTTSTTTTTVTTPSTTSKSGKSIDPWPIIGSILGLLALCALCCCCWWWLFCGGRRRRQQHREKEKSADDYLAIRNYHPKKFSSLILKHLRKPTKQTRISSIDLQDRFSPESRVTTLTPTEISTCQNVIDNRPVENTQRKSDGSVSITRIKRPSKSLSTDEKNRPNTNSEILEAKKPSVSIPMSESHSLSVTQRSSSMNISRMNRLSISNNQHFSTPTNDLAQTLNGVSVIRTSNNSITGPKCSSLYEHQRQKGTKLSSSHINKSNGNVTVTKVIKIPKL